MKRDEFLGLAFGTAAGIAFVVFGLPALMQDREQRQWKRTSKEVNREAERLRKKFTVIGSVGQA